MATASSSLAWNNPAFDGNPNEKDWSAEHDTEAIYSTIADQGVTTYPSDYRELQTTRRAEDSSGSKAPATDETANCGDHSEEAIYLNDDQLYDNEVSTNILEQNKMAPVTAECLEVAESQILVFPVDDGVVHSKGEQLTTREHGACPRRCLTPIILLLLLVIAILLGSVVYLGASGSYGQTAKNGALENIDECSSDSCSGRGFCIDHVEGYRCNCLWGFTGNHCEISINECSTAPCGSNGGCIDADDGYLCVCFPGYSGTQCQTDIDECASSPCMNRGQCNEGVNSYNCSCEAGYVGIVCETDIDECASSSCQNGGQCNDGANSHNCTCEAGYAGTLCETDINECASSPCMNGGQCEDLVNSFSCTCAAGYTGTSCETSFRTAFSCGFESGGICDYTQDTSDVFDWTPRTGQTGSSNTGPTGGHNSHGYIYIETSDPRQQGDTARISTPRLYGGLTWCIKYAYHMYGANIGTLRLYTENRSGTKTELWSASGDKGQQWFTQRRSVYLREESKIGWEGVRGSKYRGDMALDDLNVSLGPCI